MSRRTKTVRSGNAVDMEVSNLFNLKDKKQFTNSLLALRSKYPKDEDLVNQIQEVFIEKHTSIVKKAKQFAKAVRERYADKSIPFHQLLLKARAHAKKHRLSDAEFAEFQRIYEQELSGTTQNNEVVVPITNLMKVLGNVTNGMDSYVNGNMDEADYRNLQEILKSHEMNKSLHAQTLLQSMQYIDCAPQAIVGVRLDKQRQNPGEHVHPVIAAMFLPSIPIFNNHFLYSNMAGIVKSRYNSEALTTRPDYELFYNLVTDPNDVVCDTRTPLADLLHRCNLQTQLWNSVLNLRNGQVFNTSFRDFVSTVDVCRLNKYDNPDLVYGRHDGTIIKRMLSAFSFRPTVVATLPINNVFASNPYAQNVRPTVTSIPMINVRLHNYSGVNNSIAVGGPAPTTVGPPLPVFLGATLTQTQTFIEGNVLVNRVSDVVYSREVLIFYVDRRAHLLQFENNPANFPRLPAAIAGFERINRHRVKFEHVITIRPNDPDPDRFCLRSVVVSEVNPNPIGNDPRSMVIGSSAFIFGSDYVPIMTNGAITGYEPKCAATPPAYPGGPSSPAGGAPFSNIFHYSPLESIKRQVGNEVIYDTTAIPSPSNNPLFLDTVQAKDRIETQGVVFIYQNYDAKKTEEKMLTY
jgi:hypothetical protein